MPPQHRPPAPGRATSFKSLSPGSRQLRQSSARRSSSGSHSANEQQQILDEERRINTCITCIQNIEQMLQTAPHEGPTYLNLARCVIAHIDTTDFMARPTRANEKIRMISSLQCLALQNPHSDTSDIAAWCLRRWRAMTRTDPRNVTALTGLGQAWLGRAQAALSRINNVTRISKAERPGGARENTGPSNNPAESIIIEIDTPDRVEARAYLQPASRYLERAVAAACREQVESGALLVIAAEALLSLSNVSNGAAKDACMQKAVRLLSMADAMPGYQLKPELRSYLQSPVVPSNELGMC